MIARAIFVLTFLGALHCYPQKFTLTVSPEEVNSLERDEPRSIDPKTTTNSLEDTVQKVQDIIKSNPKLPRLTRGEILDLLENITTEDGKNKREPKAVMVVMPYTPNNEKNMEDLYTKAPVTHIIGAEPFKPQVEVSTNTVVKKTLPVEKKKYSSSVKTREHNQTRRKRPETTTQIAPTTYRPSTRRPIRRRTTTKHPNHRYDDAIPDGGIRIIDSPKLNPKPHKNDLEADLDIHENIQHEVFVKPPKADGYKQKQEVFFPTSLDFSSHKTPNVPKQETLTESIDFPDNLKTVVKDLNLAGAVSPEAEALTAKLEEQDKIKHMLASIGVLPAKTTTTTTTTSTPNVESVAESLSPEMRDLLMSFGLLPNPNEKPVATSDKYNPEKAEVSPDSYIGFKPLPEQGKSRDDMDALLASFGLGRSARRGKAIKESDKGFNFDMIPESLKEVVFDLGIQNSSIESPTEKPEEEESSREPKKQHVFNPDTQYATEEELQKLEKLMSVIKQLEKLNGTVTEEDLKTIDLEGLKELVSSLNIHNETLETLEEQENAPDPTAFDVDLIKNEVKRQEATTSVVIVTPESVTPSLKDLEDSFGGKTDPPTPPPVPETTTRKNGFYSLVDWNTFLDIDDTKGKRVNLRFQPTIGDPKRFLSVSVP